MSTATMAIPIQTVRPVSRRKAREDARRLMLLRTALQQEGIGATIVLRRRVLLKGAKTPSLSSYNPTTMIVFASGRHAPIAEVTMLTQWREHAYWVSPDAGQDALFLLGRHREAAAYLKEVDEKCAEPRVHSEADCPVCHHQTCPNDCRRCLTCQANTPGRN